MLEYIAKKNVVRHIIVEVYEVRNILVEANVVRNIVLEVNVVRKRSAKFRICPKTLWRRVYRSRL